MLLVYLTPLRTEPERVIVGGLISENSRGKAGSVEFSQINSENHPRNIRMFGTWSWPSKKRAMKGTKCFQDKTFGKFQYGRKVGATTHGRPSKIQTHGLDFGRRDLVFLNLLIKRAARDAKTLRSLLNAPAFLL